MKTLATLINDAFNDVYPKRPVWAIVSSLPLSNPNVSLFGEDNAFVPISVEGAGSVRARVRGFTDELTSSYGPGGVTTAPTATGAHVPTSGLYGVYVSTQTGCLNNFEAPDNGNSGVYDANSSLASTLALYSGIVVGEANWRQIYDLLLTPAGLLFKEQIGSGYNAASSAAKARINLVTDLGPAYTPALATYGFGQIAHNRNSGKLLIAQPMTGSNGVSMTHRLHIFDLRMKIGADTQLADIKAAMVTCTQAGSGRYRYVDVVSADTSVYWTDNISADIADSQFVLCDNDDIWLYKSAESAGTATAPQSLFRINVTGGTWLTGAYASTFVMRFARQAITYGSVAGTFYGAKHLCSDDNSVVALFQQNYYYCGGINLAMVSSKSAGALDFNTYTPGVIATQYTIAPSGGPGFILCNSSANNDTAGPTLAQLPNTVLNGTAQTVNWQSGLWPAVNSSTLYGANFVCKVQPTTEWK